MLYQSTSNIQTYFLCHNAFIYLNGVACISEIRHYLITSSLIEISITSSIILSKMKYKCIEIKIDYISSYQLPYILYVHYPKLDYFNFPIYNKKLLISRIRYKSPNSDPIRHQIFVHIYPVPSWNISWYHSSIKHNMYLPGHSGYKGVREWNNPDNLDINYEWVINCIVCLAQSVERWTCNSKVVSSILTSSQRNSLLSHSKLNLGVLGSILIWTNGSYNAKCISYFSKLKWKETYLPN